MLGSNPWRGSVPGLPNVRLQVCFPPNLPPTIPPGEETASRTPPRTPTTGWTSSLPRELSRGVGQQRLVDLSLESPHHHRPGQRSERAEGGGDEQTILVQS